SSRSRSCARRRDMTALDESREARGLPADGKSPAGADQAPDSVLVPDFIRLEVGRGSRVVVVSHLPLAPTASEVSTNAAGELAKVLSTFHLPGMLVIAGDGFEMLAAAPDVAGVLI